LILSFGYHFLSTWFGISGFQPKDRLIGVISFEKSLAIPSIIVSDNDERCVILGHPTDASSSLATIFYDIDSEKDRVTFEGIGDWGLAKQPDYYSDIRSLNRLLNLKMLSSYYDCAELGNKKKYGYCDIVLFHNGAVATFPAARMLNREAISIININTQFSQDLIVPDIELTNDDIAKYARLCIYDNDQHLALFYREHIFYYDISKLELTNRQTIAHKFRLISNIATNGKLLYGIYKNTEDQSVHLYEFHSLSNNYHRSRVVSCSGSPLVYASISSNSQFIALSEPTRVFNKETNGFTRAQFISRIKIIDSFELKTIDTFDIDGFCEFINFDSTSSRLALCGIDDYKTNRISSYVRIYDINTMKHISLKKINGILGNAEPQFIGKDVLVVPTGNSITIWNVKFK
jgi:hypothetical protein